MISCPNCNHQNPDGAVQCEACYTPLPQAAVCPQCGATVQSNAAFCGQCGFNLKQAVANITSELPPTVIPNPPTAPTSPPELDLNFPEVPDIELPDFPDFFEAEEAANPTVALDMPEPSNFDILETPDSPSFPPEVPLEAEMGFGSAVEMPNASSPSMATSPPVAATQIQVQTASLLHVQTDVSLEIPAHLTVIHIGKPNDTVPPDIDVSGFPNSEVVSRIHADLRQEAGIYYVEDTGSSNGTYINHAPLPVGNRHRLRPGDRLGLGKGDKVTFIFQMS
ncbi:FHA domain-containing protein [Picosynechococcus sp. NKBG15041c]|uniref:FHA domain-containing protein n=1 Tax=Picosynechococcus sp. NKBG15041c TaxID=1407650 RepID=UPI0004197FBA|nr:FHA domain-containing protein [Picosynechococcus sp. NKBG15041c]